MNKTKLKAKFVPRYINTVGKLEIFNDENECIISEVKQFEFYYDEDGNIIEEK